MSRLEDTLGRIAAFVSAHNRIVLLVMVVATVGVVAGIPQLEAEQTGAFGDELETQSDVGLAADYIDAHYGDDTHTAMADVYVRVKDGNALSREVLLSALEYEQTVLESDALTGELTERGSLGPQNLVATRLAGDPDADLATQRQALEQADEDEVAAAVAATFDGGETTGLLLPAGYEPGSTDAESFRMTFEFALKEDPGASLPTPPADAQRVLHDAASDRAGFFTLGQFARQPWVDQVQSDTIWLIIPPALVLVLAVLAFAYRDLVDVAVGFVGVVLSVLWMFGILGWMGIPASNTVVLGPVLIVALSIDFGLHVFMRYRESRGPDDGIRDAMGRSTGSVAIAFLLVTGTAAIGFLANLTNPLSMIRDLGIAITLGVVSAFVIFTTLVPALKISVDGLMERVGFDRHKTPLGHGRILRPLLSSGVDLARRGALVVIVVAILAGAAGGVAYADIDRQGFQQETEVADWKTQLPGPMAWEAAETDYKRNLEYVRNRYRSEQEALSVTRFLIEGDPTDPATLERVAAGVVAAADNEAVFTQGGNAPAESPLSVMRTVARQDDEFAAVYRAADGNGDGVPDENVTAVYDALFETAPAAASRVIERTDGGEYRTLLVSVPIEQGLDVGERGEAMHDLADEFEGDGVTATPVGVATVNNAELAILAGGILETMLIALVGVLVTLAVVYRFQHGSTLLGVATVIPIALVLGLVFGAMYLVGIPLTFVTALLVSITIGLGIDYNIHVSDRFAQELEGGADPTAALYTAATGTGGALLGSVLTSGAAFTTLLLHTSPQIRSFGAIVVVALSLSFLLSVFVLPSLLYVWAYRIREVDAPGVAEPTPED